MIKPATEKQKKFAQQISAILGIELPDNDSMYDYSVFISDNIENFKAAQQKFYIFSRKIDRECKQRKYIRFQNPYSGPYDSDVIDSYDYGIYPWGDS